MDPILGEIRMVGWSYAPPGWISCEGQLLPINQNEALYSLLGTTYGGDGMTTFGIPDMRGRIPIGCGKVGNAGDIGRNGGNESVTLTQSQIPAHQHDLAVYNGNADTAVPTAGQSLAVVLNAAVPPVQVNRFGSGTPPNLTLSQASLGAGPGQSLPHENLMPHLGMRYLMATEGIYPQRP